VDQVNLELAAASQQQTASDEGENPYHHRGGHTGPQSGAMYALLIRDTMKVMYGMSKVQCREQDGNST